jgi:hypothetical protein
MDPSIPSPVHLSLQPILGGTGSPMRQWLGHADCQAHLAGRLRSSVAVVPCQLPSLAHMLRGLTSRPRQATHTGLAGWEWEHSSAKGRDGHWHVVTSSVQCHFAGASLTAIRRRQQRLVKQCPTLLQRGPAVGAVEGQGSTPRLDQ